MTYEEAKFWFETTLESGEWLTPAEEDYYNVAAECIEKQIPKKPIRNTGKIHNAWIESVALCPTCINYVGNYDANVIDHFCRECGQAIGEVE